MTLTYKQLPDSTLDTGECLMCPECGEGPWSATRGDYFTNDDDETVCCAFCDADMVLVRKVTYYQEVTG